MSSPAPAPQNSGDRAKKPLEQITFRFCSECSNMLYPKEDEVERKLLFTCRTCSFSEEAQSSCIFRNVLNNAAGETAGVTQDVGSDPTVSFAFLTPELIKQWKKTIPPSSLLWCACCGMPIKCDVCWQDTAAIEEKDTITPSFPAVHDPFTIEVSPIAWDMSDEDIGVFNPDAEKHYDSLLEVNEDYDAKFNSPDSPDDKEMDDVFYHTAMINGLPDEL